jgi:TetR/AcrR family transcriptional regulator
MRSGVMEKLDSQQKILFAARDEFGKFGLDGARVDRIARKAKVNKAMIYYHFRSKDKLYQAVIDDHISKIEAFLEKTIAEETNPETFILKIAGFFNSISLDKASFVPIILREMAQGSDRIKVGLTRVIAEKGLGKKLEKMIADGVKNGQFRKINIKQAIISFWGMNIFYLLLAPIVNSVWEIQDEKSFREQRAKEVADIFLNGLKAR